MDRKAVHALAEKHLSRFCSRKAYSVDWDEDAFRDFNAAGLIMDEGESFQRVCGRDAFFEPLALLQHINQIKNAEFLGSALYSKWRYLTYWSTGDLDHVWENQIWFVMVLLRLSQLTAGKEDFRPHLSRHRVRKIRLINCAGGPCRWEPGDKTKERLIIWEDGKVRRTIYHLGKRGNVDEKQSDSVFQVAMEDVRVVFDLFTLFARSDRFLKKCMVPVLDGNSWTLQMWSRNGTNDRYQGYGSIRIGPLDLSAVLRTQLHIPDAWLFDEKDCSRKILKISMECGLKWPAGSSHFIERMDTRREYFMLDGASDTLTYWRETNGGRDMERYTFSGGVERFLETFDGYQLFAGGEDEPVRILKEDNTTDYSGQYIYSLRVAYLSAPEQVWTGIFDADGLPPDWDDFMKKVHAFYEEHLIHGTLLDPKRYLWRPRRPGESIYCHVVFEEGGKTYCYRTEDDSIQPGDRVLVPVGPENETKAVTVVRVEYVRPEDAPYPPAKTKIILGKMK